MKKLSLNQGIAVAVALVATFVILFFSSYIFGGASGAQNQATTQKAAVSDTVSNTASDLGGAIKVENTAVGTGRAVNSGDTISVHYIGALADGTKFDNSYDRGEPISFTVGAGQLIKGFDEGVVGMQINGKRKITIPPELGYGAQQVGPIPANSTLVFEVELVSIK